jgi:murein DD-endopeptidase MepM/ murein hydrolase activator NlpD
MIKRDNTGAHCASSSIIRSISSTLFVTLFLLTVFGGVSSAEVGAVQKAFSIAGALPGGHRPPEKRSNIVETAEAAISSVKEIVNLMKQAQEITAMLPSSNHSQLSSVKTDLDTAMEIAASVPSFPAQAAKPSETKPIIAEKPKTQDKLAQAATPKPAANKPRQELTLPGSQKLIWPVDGTIYSAFNASRGRRKHGAVDIVTSKGTPIAAAADGIVSVAANGGKNFSGYGKIIILDHGRGCHTVYAHCDTLIVKMGQKVKQGEYIGTVGRTGSATTDHVHFEVRMAGKKHDPLAYLPTRPNVVKATNYHSSGKKSK